MSDQALIIALVIVATISATRSARHARWPIWAAITFAVGPLLITALSRFAVAVPLATSYGLQASFVAWPVAWALIIGWFFRASWRQEKQQKNHKQKGKRA